MDIRKRPNDEEKYTPKEDGAFKRSKCRLQGWIDEPSKGRYHVFVSFGCGWCHQVLITIKLKGLEDVISVSHVGLNRIRDPSYKGWSVPDDPTGNKFSSAYDVYNSNRKSYGTNQMTIPILFDKKTSTVISNDPAQIILMLNETFDKFARRSLNLYPKKKRVEIEKVNDVVFPGINDGVYRCWFAGNDKVFEKQFQIVQNALDYVENECLRDSEFLCGDKVTLADVRAFPHLFRFDVIYHFLCMRNKGKRVSGLKRTSAWMKRMYEKVGVGGEGVDDLQLATQFYLMGGRNNISAEDCDLKFYNKFKCDWMPSIEKLRSRRKRLGIDRAPYVVNINVYEK
jgi:glutathionyl-hydroquinone reductase